ncbi:MAG: phosphate regulon transcriptional regulator PhoB [Porticoccaceae bacterium]|jgi:two-component system, OmpR family, phosphate regulon response regulator PhoB|nr:phosphate regulon transcriptional regulator PhoB [Porticoccaceae bacterium]
MSRKTVLIVDDEAAIREMLKVALEIAEFDCIEAKNAYEAQVAVTDQRPDLVLLDWMMPEVSGLELLRRWRQNEETASLPVIMLTAKAEEENTVKGLDTGADDYISKPFSPRELASRIKALMRRTQPDAPEDMLRTADLAIDPVSRRVTIKDQPIALGPTEYRLLEFFMTHPDRAFTREQLLNKVWGANVYIDERTIDVHIRRLRKALSIDNYENTIQTVRGFGYRFSKEALVKSPD